MRRHSRSAEKGEAEGGEAAKKKQRREMKRGTNGVGTGLRPKCKSDRVEPANGEGNIAFIAEELSECQIFSGHQLLPTDE